MKILILSFVFLLSINFVSAQYRSYKVNYNVKTYSFQENDRYKPGTAGALAFFPGAGHCYDGEPIRGLAFVGGMVGSFGVAVAGFALLPWDESGSSEVPGYVVGAIGWAGFATFYVWSIIDAVNVAKIKNMAIRDKAISFKFEPYFESGFQKRLLSDNAGLSLKINF